MPISRVTGFSNVTEFSDVTELSNASEVSNITALHGEPMLFAPTDIEPAGDLTIDCDCCALRNTAACDDCVVSFLLEREPDDAVVIDADEARAMRMLERAGLVPTLRFSTQAG
jgi:hypothetical protein